MNEDPATRMHSAKKKTPAKSRCFLPYFSITKPNGEKQTSS